jgi:bifunctional UDP-N-acetylglucosamine pyrophosphorylase/glucosamine-1-phosphate N-acetyltransferase
MTIALVILAAGKGTRMNSDLPKVLHQLGQAPMLAHAMAAGRALDPSRVIVVAGHGADAVRAAVADIDEEAQVVLQTEQLGTAHAVAQARDAIGGFDGDAVVLYGDTPFIRAETLDRMLAARAQADVVVLGFHAADPGRYGRLVTEGDALLRIVEYKDATDEERAITLCNSGLIVARAEVLFDLVAAVGNDNAAGEYYLTDIVELARARGLRTGFVTCDEAETLGINSQIGTSADFRSGKPALWLKVCAVKAEGAVVIGEAQRHAIDARNPPAPRQGGGAVIQMRLQCRGEGFHECVRFAVEL